MGAVEVVKAFVSPLEKLITTVSGAIGKAYEPRHIRKVADAEAYRLNLIADTVRNNSDLPIVYNSEGVNIDTRDYEDITRRASRRMAYQELMKQQNIESVVDKAYMELENSELVSDEPVSEDWVSRFFNSVENISDETMQQIWARILAGEVKKPNTYSYRTIEKLKNMTRQEAEVYQKVSSLLLIGAGRAFIINNDSILKKYGVSYDDILKLEECGLMTSQALELTIEQEKQQVNIWNDKYIGIIGIGEQNKLQSLKLNIYMFTESGKELYKAIKPQGNKQYFIDFLLMMHRSHNRYAVSMHEVNYFIDDEKVNYKTKDILADQV